MIYIFKKTNNLFSDDDDNFEEEKKKPAKKQSDNAFSDSENEEEEERKEEAAEPVKMPKALDFASELSSKLASKKKNTSNEEQDNNNEAPVTKVETKQPEVKKPVKTNVISLFDNSSEDEESGIFASKPKPVVKETPKASKKASLFSESDSDKEEEKIKKAAPIKPNEEKTKTSSILSKIDSDSSDDINFLKKPPQIEPKKTVIKIE
jgi:hypothetical protein